MYLPANLHPVTRAIISAAHSDWILVVLGVAAIAMVIARIATGA